MKIILGVLIFLLEFGIGLFPYKRLKNATKLEMISFCLTSVAKTFLSYPIVIILLYVFSGISFATTFNSMFFEGIGFVFQFHSIVVGCLIILALCSSWIKFDVKILHNPLATSKGKADSIFLTLFIFFTVQSICLFFYMGYFFPRVDVDQLLFTIFVPATGMSNVILKTSIIVLLLIPSVMAVTCFILKKLKLDIAIHFSINVENILQAIIKRKRIYTGLFAVFAILVLFVRFPVVEFVKRVMASKSTFYETYYIDPKKVNFKFPEKKRNLIFIYLESLEAEGSHSILPGINLIPELSKLAKDNLSFSHNGDIGGALQVVGTTNSISSCCNTHVGLPLLVADQIDISRYAKSLFANAYGLGDILSMGGGYVTSYITGSFGSSYGMKAFLETHGFPLKSLEHWREIGKVPKDYFVWWGVEDKKLVEFSKEELLNLSKQEKPFAFSVFFEDTHFPSGYVCEECNNQYVKSIHNVYACTSKRIGKFVEWIKRQSFYEDTLIVILGDHLYMGDDLYENSNRDKCLRNHNRHAYNCFINVTKDYTKFSKNRAFCTFDYFPTIIDCLDIEYEEEGLGIGRSLVREGKTLLEELGEEELAQEMVKKNDLYKQLLLK